MVGNDRRSQIGIVFLALMTMAFNGIVIFGFRNYEGFELILQVRSMHFVMAFISLILLFLFRKSWTPKMASLTFLALMLPLFVVGWLNHLAMVSSKEPWIPFKGYYVIVLGLAVITPATYILNMILLAGFFIEIVALWFALDMAHRPNIILSGEPYYIIGTSVICFLILWSRYQDEKTIRLLEAEKVKGEISKSLARVLLTIRDRMNTPLQNISLLLHILRKSSSMTEQKAKTLEKSLNSIVKINSQFNRLEVLIDWQGENLMTDAEIDTWLNSLDATKK